MQSIRGRRALVGGASQGIGRACAIELARQGAAVTAMARDEQALKRVVADLPAEAGQSHGFLVADSTDADALGAKIKQLISDTGPVHILVNNTGGPPSGPLSEATAEALRAGFGQHVVSFQTIVQHALAGMKEAGYGRIVNIISTSVLMPIRGLGVSNTTRGAVANWGRTLAGELGAFGITVNNILPGYTDTARLRSLLQKWADRDGTTLEAVQRKSFDAIPLGRFAAPEEIAAVVAFLASPAASYVSGVNLPVDGGRTAVQ